MESLDASCEDKRKVGRVTMSLTSMVEKQLGRNFVIFHPSDFSVPSEVAFGHALKIAMRAKAKLDIMHVVETHLSSEKPYWQDFPAVRATLSRWGILPEGVRRDEVAKACLRIRKALKSGADPVKTMLRHFRRLPPDLIVLATLRGKALNGGCIKRSQSHLRVDREQ